MSAPARLVLLVGIAALGGCAGKTAPVDTGALVAPTIQVQGGEPGYKAKGAVGFQVTGNETFSGRAASGFPGGINPWLSVSVDLKSLQEKLGPLVLKSIYDTVESSRNDPMIRSSISEFSYLWPAEPAWTLRLDDRPVVSFRLQLQAVRGGKVAVERVIVVKDYEAKKGAIPWGFLFGEVGGIFFLQKDADRFSRVVSEAAAQATYEAYLKELPVLARALAE